MKTSLHLIVKDELDNVKKIIHQAKPYFDSIYVTVSDLKTFHELQREPIYVDYREWTGKFDEARQHNWDKGADYDASFWLDADDAFDFSRIPEIFAQLKEYDAVFLPYEYKHDENGNCIVKHPRERAISRRKNFYWKGWVHENLICDEGFTKIDLDIPVVHLQTDNHEESSLQRNHEILIKAVQETQDPRYLHYLGISYFTLHEYQNAITTLNEYIKVGGWDEEVYRSVTKISESYFMLGEVDTAIMEALKATAILPNYPQAFHLLCHYESQANNHEQAIEWGKVALSKPDPKGASIYDPTSRDRTMLTMSLSYYALGDYMQAYTLMSKVRAIDTSDILDTFKYMAEVITLKKVLPGLYQFYDDPSILWDKLTNVVKYMPEMRKIREQLTKPKIWPSNSIVFFCGKGYEEWGPHTLNKGMGGSEEAIVYLAPQLAKLGYEVTIYGEVDEPIMWGEGTDSFVRWLPWNYIDKRDDFSTLVVWRMPQFAGQFKAKKLFVDMHDQLPKDVVKPYENVTYLFKSQYHKDFYPNITNYAIIPNGIDVEQFNGKA